MREKGNELKYSIIIPNYNSGKTIRETIESVLSQNYKNIELIIVDGASKDNSLNVIGSFKEKISCLISEPDLGQADAINKGLKIATGDYICFLNADDTLESNCLGLLNKITIGTNYDFIFGPVLAGKTPSQCNPIPLAIIKPTLLNLLLFFFNSRYIIPSQGVWIKRDFLIQNKLMYLNTSLHFCMDMDWYCRIIQSNPKIYRYNRPLAFFRLDGNTKTLTQSREMKFESLRVAHQYLKNLSESDRKIWYKYRYLDRALRLAYANRLSLKPITFFWIMKKSGSLPLKDKRFIGLLRNIRLA